MKSDINRFSAINNFSPKGVSNNMNKEILAKALDEQMAVHLNKNQVQQNSRNYRFEPLVSTAKSNVNKTAMVNRTRPTTNNLGRQSTFHQKSKSSGKT